MVASSEDQRIYTDMVSIGDDLIGYVVEEFDVFERFCRTVQSLDIEICLVLHV